MIMKSYLVFASEQGFRAAQHIEGHNGLKKIQPHLTGKELFAPSLDDLRLMIGEEKFELDSKGKIAAKYRSRYPDLLEFWFNQACAAPPQ